MSFQVSKRGDEIQIIDINWGGNRVSLPDDTQYVHLNKKVYNEPGYYYNSLR